MSQYKHTDMQQQTVLIEWSSAATWKYKQKEKANVTKGEMRLQPNC